MVLCVGMQKCGFVAVRGKRIRSCVLHMGGSVKDGKKGKKVECELRIILDPLLSRSVCAFHLHQVSVNRISWNTDYSRMHCCNYWFRQLKKKR